MKLRIGVTVQRHTKSILHKGCFFNQVGVATTLALIVLPSCLLLFLEALFFAFKCEALFVLKSHAETGRIVLLENYFTGQQFYWKLPVWFNISTSVAFINGFTVRWEDINKIENWKFFQQDLHKVWKGLGIPGLCNTLPRKSIHPFGDFSYKLAVFHFSLLNKKPIFSEFYFETWYITSKLKILDQNCFLTIFKTFHVRCHHKIVNFLLFGYFSCL